MVLPLSLLKSSQNHQMLIELKNGDTYIGKLIGCDSWMNVHLKDAIFTSNDGLKFLKIDEIFIRGPTIKLMNIPEKVMSDVNDEVVEVRRQQGSQQSHNRFRRNNNMGYNRGGGRGGAGNNMNRNSGNSGYRQYNRSDDREHHHQGGSNDGHSSRGGGNNRYDNRQQHQQHRNQQSNRR